MLCLKPISIALDRNLKDSQSIAKDTDVWKKVETDLKENVLDNCKASNVSKCFKNKHDQAFEASVFFFIYLLSPTFQPDNLNTEEKTK